MTNQKSKSAIYEGIFLSMVVLVLILFEIFTLIGIKQENKLVDVIVNEVATSKNELENIYSLFKWVHNKAGASDLRVNASQPLIDRETPLHKLIFSTNYYCGRSAKIFTVLLRHIGVPARLLFLYKYDDILHYADIRHIVVEVYYQKRWVVFDPFFGYYYPINDTLLASAEDLKNTPFLLEKVVDKNSYPLFLYNYQDARRSNWVKIPILLPAIYKLLKNFAPEKIDLIAFNVLILRELIFQSYCLILLCLIIIFALYVEVIRPLIKYSRSKERKAKT